MEFPLHRHRTGDFVALGRKLKWVIHPHAVERYIERVRPSYTYQEALDRLLDLSDEARFERRAHPSGNFDRYHAGEVTFLVQRWSTDNGGDHRRDRKQRMLVMSVLKRLTMEEWKKGGMP